MTTLYLTLHEEYFNLIATGHKHTEYRSDKPYWRTRLHGRTFDHVHFTNGYGAHRPNMLVECLGITPGQWQDKPAFLIHLGNILHIYNWTHPLDQLPTGGHQDD